MKEFFAFRSFEKQFRDGVFGAFASAVESHFVFAFEILRQRHGCFTIGIEYRNFVPFWPTILADFTYIFRTNCIITDMQINMTQRLGACENLRRDGHVMQLRLS